MSYFTNSWSILPATDALFNKTKVTLERAMLEMGSYSTDKHTMLVCERDNGYGKKSTRLMLSSSGEMNLPVGTEHKAHHDQTGRPYGYLKVLAVVSYIVIKDADDKNQVVTTLPMGVSLDTNLPLFVFK